MKKITFFNIGRAPTSKSLFHYSTLTEALFFKCLLYFTALVIWYFCLFVCHVTLPTYFFMEMEYKCHLSRGTTEEHFLSYRKIENPLEKKIRPSKSEDLIGLIKWFMNWAASPLTSREISKESYKMEHFYGKEGGVRSY